VHSGDAWTDTVAGDTANIGEKYNAAAACPTSTRINAETTDFDTSLVRFFVLSRAALELLVILSCRTATFAIG
jgi:hypothetical protein